MDPLTIAGIGAGLGLLKSQTLDKDKERRQRELAAKTISLSPWTGMRAGGIQEADPIGSALATGLSGYQIGTGIENQALNKKIADKMLSDEIKKSAEESTPETELQPTQFSGLPAYLHRYPEKTAQISNYSFVPLWTSF